MSDFSNERLGRIIQLIGSNPGITLTQLRMALEAEGIVVTERTVAKDVLSLKRDFRLLPDKERLRSGYVLNGMVSLSEKEASLVCDVLDVFSNRFSDRESQKLLSRLAPARAVRTRTTRQRTSYAHKEATHMGLVGAIRSHRAVLIEYVTPRLKKPQRIECFPLIMVFHEPGWYCIAKDLSSDDYYPRRVDRIKSFQLMPEINADPEDDLVTAEFLMSSGWGMTFPRNVTELAKSDVAPPIVARFDSAVAPYILESLHRHPRGTVSAARDGSGDALFRIRLSDPQEFLHWIRSFGSRAWIVSPSSIVEKEKAEVRRMYDRYFRS